MSACAFCAPGAMGDRFQSPTGECRCHTFWSCRRHRPWRARRRVQRARRRAHAARRRRRPRRCPSPPPLRPSLPRSSCRQPRHRRRPRGAPPVRRSAADLIIVDHRHCRCQRARPCSWRRWPRRCRCHRHRHRRLAPRRRPRGPPLRPSRHRIYVGLVGMSKVSAFW